MNLVFLLKSLSKRVPASLFSAQAFIGKQGISSLTVFSFFSIPGDPTVNIGDAALTAADLLNAFDVKLPPFWLDNIETWLVQSGSQFRLKGVAQSQTKFGYCLQSMSLGDSVKIGNSPAKDPYCHLKERLLPMYALNNYAPYEAISNFPLTGDMHYAAFHSDV